MPVQASLKEEVWAMPVQASLKQVVWAMAVQASVNEVVWAMLAHAAAMSGKEEERDDHRMSGDGDGQSKSGEFNRETSLVPRDNG